MRRLQLVGAATATALVAGMMGVSAQADTPPEQLTPGDVLGVPVGIQHRSDPNIAAWQRLQFGLFLHWGVYSEFGGYYKGEKQSIGYPEQIKAWSDITDADYLDAAANMSADEWNPDAVCKMAKDAGMKYVVITSKHHDGFAMWDTDTTDYNVVEKTPYGKDVVKGLSDACRAQGVGFGVYFSSIDWTLQEPEPYQNRNPIADDMMPYIDAQLTELMTDYGTIDEVWFDMGAPTPAQSQEMADVVHEHQPDAMVSSRVWNDKGDFEVGWDNRVATELQVAPWQAAVSIFPKCWGYCSWPEIDRSDANKLPRVRGVVDQLMTVISGGGQYLFNVGPKGDGSIDPFDSGVLEGVGEWIDRHPDAAIGALGTYFGRQPWGTITVNDDALYLTVTSVPDSRTITVPGLSNAVRVVSLDGSDTPLPYSRDGLDLKITLPADNIDSVRTVVRVETVAAPGMVPEETVTLDESGALIPAEKVISRNSPKPQTGPAELDAFVLNDREDGLEDVAVLVKGTGIVAEQEYRVSVGDDSVVVTGEELEAGPVGGGFVVGPNRAERVRVVLEDPDYFADPVAISITSITLSGVRATSPSPTPSVTTSPSVTVSPTTTTSPTATTAPTTSPEDMYTTPGLHHVNGRHWVTMCEPYSKTQRCRTDIWSSQVRRVGNSYAVVTGWHFNNLTYLPSPKSLWAGNPLATPGNFTSDGRRWRTECNTPAVGGNGCRSYIWTSVIETVKSPSGNRYQTANKWVFNNIVRFS